MNQGDYVEFSKLWQKISKCQAGHGIDDDGVEWAFSLLPDLTLSEVKHAAFTHGRQSEWMPRPAEIIKIALGELPSCEALFALAGEDTTAIGRYVRSLIGNDAKTLHPKQGAIRVSTKLSSITDFYDRALRAEYTDTELRMLLTAEIDLTKPIAPNCPKTRVPYRAALMAAIERTVIPKQVEQSEPEMSEADAIAGKKQLAELMKSLGR